ncbi:P-loop containing nucleoside triphosphate hydrolase protein [Hypoxylon cercidicola]|nr:P-loop containing nucleoside triphosphate hydrolase protein [Hypoxylon cercidicola]
MAAPLKTAAAGFVPRRVFEVSPSITRSYFLGHHAGALRSMHKILSNISLILECRDSRVPLTSTNPLLEAALAGRDRIVVYTKADLCAPASANRWLEKQQQLLTEFHSAPRAGAGTTQVLFTDERNLRLMRQLMGAVKARAAAEESLTGVQVLVVGMPNAGKSTLLNALRRVGMRLPKAALTGAQPGVTRRMGMPVRVIPEDVPGGIDRGVFVIDTPGVFVPYVGDVESMLKLALVGCVKDGLVPAETVADYMLFHLNLRDPGLYAELCPPTNDVREFLDTVALRTGKLRRGGLPSQEQAADWVLQQWRKGNLGRFGLDDVSEEGLRAWRAKGLTGDYQQLLSLSQAKKREKDARKERYMAKRQAAEGA